MEPTQPNDTPSPPPDDLSPGKVPAANGNQREQRDDPALQQQLAPGIPYPLSSFVAVLATVYAIILLYALCCGGGILGALLFFPGCIAAAIVVPRIFRTGILSSVLVGVMLWWNVLVGAFSVLVVGPEWEGGIQSMALLSILNPCAGFFGFLYGLTVGMCNRRLL